MTQDFSGYIKEKQSIDIFKANKFGLFLLLGIFIFFLLLFYIVWPDSFKDRVVELFRSESVLDFMGGVAKLLAILIFGIILHELIHGIFWALFAKRGFRSVKLGILKQYLTPYCHSKEPLKVWQYIVGAVMPAIFLGLLPLAYALVAGNLGWLFFGIFFTAAAGGDFLMMRLLMKEKMNDWVQDHPSEPGFYMFRKKE